MEKIFYNDDNDSMAFLRGNGLRELLLYVQSNLLDYRKTIGLSKDTTFGLELEYENLAKIKVDRFIDERLENWDSDIDGTVSSGGEVRSPILQDSEKTWKELQLICNFLKSQGAHTKNKAGGHIHVGVHVLGEDLNAWITFLKLYSIYEHVLFRFFYGDKINERDLQYKYAPAVAMSIKMVALELQRTKDLVSVLQSNLPGGWYAINFNNVNYDNLNNQRTNNTIEFRAPNGTVNEVIEQNNVNVVTKMLEAAKSGEINMDFLDYKLEKEFFPYNTHQLLYKEICLKDALEFVDLIFNCNIDKIYFLRQYLKDFSSNYKSENVAFAKVFYK